MKFKTTRANVFYREHLAGIVSKLPEIKTFINYSFLNQETKNIYLEHILLSMKKLNNKKG